MELVYLMIETLTDYSVHIQLVTTIVTALAMIILVFVTWKYTNATKTMADTMYKQFVYEHKPYLSVKYSQKESNHAPILELKNHSEKNEIKVCYNLFLISPEKASNIIELQKPETLEKAKLLLSGDIDIEPNDSEALIPIALIYSGLNEMGVDIAKDYQYGIAIKVKYTPDIPDVASFTILKYWHIVKFAEDDMYIIMPLNYRLSP